MSISECVPALLVLEDGTTFHGNACGALGETFGEVCFNTSLVGYQEVISDPSYAGQIITMTYPQIGNYGVNRADMQRNTLALRGLVVHDMCYTPSNFRSESNLPDFLRDQGIVAISGIDTRMLTRHIRDNGAMRGCISTTDLDEASVLGKVRQSPSIVGCNLVESVSCRERFIFDNDTYAKPDIKGSAGRAMEAREHCDKSYNVVAYDCGAKRSILRGLADVGCNVTVVPWTRRRKRSSTLLPTVCSSRTGQVTPLLCMRPWKRHVHSLGRYPCSASAWGIR